ncbi:hypothetical protein RYX36_000417 [Vicia faba]
MQLDLESLSEATSREIGPLVSTTVLYPLDTCKTKYQAEVQARNQRKYRIISDVLWEAVFKRQYTAFDQLKNRLLKGKVSKKTDAKSSPKSMSAFNDFLLGEVLKCAATGHTHRYHDRTRWEYHRLSIWCNVTV